VSSRSRKLSFCIDEHLYVCFAERLARHGRHKVAEVKAGMDDRAILMSAEAILVTRDRDFARLSRDAAGTHRGVIIVQTSTTDMDSMFDRFLRFLRSGHADEAARAVVILHDHDFLIMTTGGTQTFRYEK